MPNASVGWLVLDGFGGNETRQGLAVLLLEFRWRSLSCRRVRLLTESTAGFVDAKSVGFTSCRCGDAALIDHGSTQLPVGPDSVCPFGGRPSLQPVRQALIPLLVPDRLLMNAVALNALAMTTSMILSAPLVKIAGDLYDFEGVYGVQVIMLVLGLLVVRRMRTPEVKEALRRRLLQETASALRHVVSDIRLRVLFLLLAVAALSVNTAVMVTMQAKLKEELLATARHGYLLAVMALGIAITSVIVMRQGDMKRKGGKFQRAMMCGSAIVACMGQASSFRVLIPLFFLMGLAGGVYITMNQGLIQSNTPKDLMRRVMAPYLLVQAGLMPLGALGLGWAASSIGTGNVITICGVISLIVVIWTHLGFPTVRNLD